MSATLDRLARWPLLPLVLLGASLLFRSLSFVPAVIDTDEGLYILQARAWLAGTWPLIGVWDMHPIGAPALVSLALLLPLPVIAAVRLLGALAVAATGTALAMLARTLGLSPVAALGAGLLSAALTTQFGGLATNTEILFAPFIAAALALATAEAVAALDRHAPPRPTRLVLAGALVGLALTIKPVAFVEGCFAFAVAVGPALGLGLVAPRRALVLAAAYALACGAPTGLIALAYAEQGAFGLFVDVWFRAPFRYAGETPPFRSTAWMLVSAALVVAWPLALTAAAALLRRTVLRPFAFGAAWFLVATLAVAAPGMFFDHYFLIWLPPVSLLAAAGASALAARVVPARADAAAAGLLLLVAVNSWLSDAARRIETGPGFRRPDPVRLVSAELAAIAGSGAAVFIANYHPVVHALSRTEPVSRYVFPAQITGAFGAVLDTDADSEVARILATLPKAIVIDRGWWTAMRPTVRRMLENTLASHYTMAAAVAEERGPVEIHRLRGTP